MATDYIYNALEDDPVPPGEHIREILEERGISQMDFALRLGRSEKFVSQLINGKAALTYDTAIELERVTSVSASFWNRSEAIYRGVLARMRREEEVAEHAEWAKSFPLKEMISKGLIAKEDSPAQQAAGLLNYFGVSSVDAYTAYWGSERRLAARMSTAYTASTPAITAWIRAGEREAEKIRTSPYSEPTFRQVLAELRLETCLTPDEWLPRLQSRCADAGVAVVLIPDLPKTRLHAVSWWANRTKAVIQLGLRYKTDDQIWFSFFHEAGHRLLDDRNRMGITDLNGDATAERRANKFASDFLISPTEYEEWVVTEGHRSRAGVIAFAQEQGVAPSIVVGRLQHDGHIPRSWMNDLKTTLAWDR